MKYELFWGWVGMKNSNVGHDNFEILMRPPSEDIMTSQRKGKKKKSDWEHEKLKMQATTFKFVIPKAPFSRIYVNVNITNNS